MKRKTVSVDIISSCVCRDSFEIGKRQSKCFEYKVDLFYQATSPFSLYSIPNEELKWIKEENLVFGSPWQRRLMISEINKNIFSSFTSQKTDNYLILDFTDFAKPLYSMSAQQPMYILQTDPARNNISLFEKYIKKVILPWDLPEQYIEECMSSYAQQILKRYESNKIVVCEIYHTSEYISSNNTIETFITNNNKANEFLKYCYRFMIEALSRGGNDINIIRMPINCIGTEAHKWGKCSLHFCDDIYEYIFSSIDLICRNLDPTEQESGLNTLLDQIEKNLTTIRQLAKLNQTIQKHIKYSAEIAKENECLILEKHNIIEEKNRILDNNLVLTKKLKESEKQLLFEKTNCEFLRKEIEEIRKSKSYKFGRLITYIPRKMKRKVK